MDDIRQAVIDQVANAVRWGDCVAALADHGVRTVVEMGETKALSSMSRGVDSRLRSFSLLQPSTVDRLAEEFGTHRQTAGSAI